MEKLLKAIEIAKSSLQEIQGTVIDVTVEQAVLNDEASQYEITLSYKVVGKDKLSERQDNLGLAALYAMPSFGRTYKTFLVDKLTGSFKGFKIFKEA